MVTCGHLAPEGGKMKSGPKFKIFKPIFLKNGSTDFSKNFRVERAWSFLPMCKFWGKFISGKNLRSKFKKISLGGPDPQTVQKIPEWLGGVCGGRRPPSTCSKIPPHPKPILRNLGKNENLLFPLASKPEVVTSRDSSCRQGSTAPTLC